MSFFQESGVLTSRTTTGTDVVTLTGSGASLDVKLVKLVMNGATATGAADADFLMASGISDGTNDRAAFMFSEDGVGTTNAFRSGHNNAVLVIYDSSLSVIDLGVISAMGNGTFTINWTTKSSAAYLIEWVAVGGSEISSEVGTFVSSTSTGAQNISTTIKSADAGFFLGAATSTATINTAVTQGLFGFGMADSNLNQGTVGVSSKNLVGTSDTDRVTDASNWINLINSGVDFLLADVTAFDATNGIQLNWTTVDATGRDCFYALVKGGRWEVGSGTTNTSATTKAFTTTFQPVGLTTAHTASTSLGTVQAAALITLGSTDGTNQSSVGAGDSDNFTTTDAGTHTTTSYCLAAHGASGTPAILGLGKFDSFNALDFTLDWADDADSSARDFIFMVCAGSSGLLVHPGMSGGMDDLLGGLRA